MKFQIHAGPELLSAQDFLGLRPRKWLCIGPGFAREEIKEWLLGHDSASGSGLIAQAVTSLEDLCRKIVSQVPETKRLVRNDQILGPLTRQEALRTLLGKRKISEYFPELRRLRRQRGFFRKLDRALQNGPLAFAHDDEEAVLEQRLRQRLGESPVRAELQRFRAAFEAWLQGKELWDAPLLLKEAIAILSSDDFKLRGFPEGIVVLRAQLSESREQAFWDALSRHLSVETLGIEEASGNSGERDEISKSAMTVERWHTLDDAVERLADTLTEEDDLGQHAILIPDHPEVRRSVTRTLKERGIPMIDPRDPTRLKKDESLKQALLPLEVIGRNFSRQTVIDWVRGLDLPEKASWVREIQERGIHQGLENYRGGRLEPLYVRLTQLKDRLGGKRSCEELAQAHLDGFGTPPPTLEALWRDLIQDLGITDQSSRCAPPLFWLERLQERLNQATPPVDVLKPAEGVALHRLGQVPWIKPKRLWIVGFPAGWFSGKGSGDYWFSEREREILSSEFAIRGSKQVRSERLASLPPWIADAEVVFLDAEYGWDGTERETLKADLNELGGELSVEVSWKTFGSHPRWRESFGRSLLLQPQSIQLTDLRTRNGIASGIPVEIRASDLDHYSKCSFQGLAASRWRTWDSREAEFELWADVRGNILHEAIRLLLESRADDGTFGKPIEDALEQAWSQHRPKGLLRSQRLVSQVRRSLLEVLNKFTEKEAVYALKSQTRIASLEGPKLSLDFPEQSPEFRIVGVPDRVDEHDDGLFVMDYKTSSRLASGREMVEQGYRLQLPFYALATRKQLEKEVLGVQFIELNKKGARGKGIFLSRWNGKEEGKLTHLRKNSASLLEKAPEEVWADCASHVEAEARAFFEGRFEASPKRADECGLCKFSDLCGYRRVRTNESDGTEAGEGV